jgi:hypothetical protein
MWVTGRKVLSEAKAHQRRAGRSDATTGRHPMERSGIGMPLGAATKWRGIKG